MESSDHSSGLYHRDLQGLKGTFVMFYTSVMYTALQVEGQAENVSVIRTISDQK